MYEPCNLYQYLCETFHILSEYRPFIPSLVNDFCQKHEQAQILNFLIFKPNTENHGGKLEALTSQFWILTI